MKLWARMGTPFSLAALTAVTAESVPIGLMLMPSTPFSSNCCTVVTKAWKSPSLAGAWTSSVQPSSPRCAVAPSTMATWKGLVSAGGHEADRRRCRPAPRRAPLAAAMASSPVMLRSLVRGRMVVPPCSSSLGRPALSARPAPRVCTRSATTCLASLVTSPQSQRQPRDLATTHVVSSSTASTMMVPIMISFALRWERLR